MIQFEVEGSTVLDLFAGSGQMGIEALSRGAGLCVFVDNARASLQALRANLAHTGFAGRARVVASDAGAFLQNARDLFDTVYLDPPYDSGLARKLLPLVAAVMREGGVILCEHRHGEKMPDRAGAFPLKKQYRYGKAGISLYRMPDGQELRPDGGHHGESSLPGQL